MVIADTSVWIEHFRSPQAPLIRLISEGQLGIHPYVVGELALGSVPDRANLLTVLQSLPRRSESGVEALLAFVDAHELRSKGIGYVDAHLLMTCAGNDDWLWTFDKRLLAQAERLNLAYRP